MWNKIVLKCSLIILILIFSLKNSYSALIQVPIEEICAISTKFSCTLKANSTFNDNDFELISKRSHHEFYELYFYQSSFKKLPKFLLTIFSNTRTLIAAKCDIETVEKSDFAAKVEVGEGGTIIGIEERSSTTLQRIDLHGNNLKILQNFTFVLVPNLEALILHTNKIACIEEDAFKGLPSLAELELNGNQLETLGKDFFQHIPNLETVNLAGNKIHLIHYNTFAALRQLRLLDLQSNQFEAIHVKDLSHLILDNGSVKTCYIQGSCTQIDAISNNLSELVVHNVTYTKVLNLRNNSFNSLDFLKCFRSLESLDISENSLDGKSLQHFHDAFKSLVSLRKLSLMNLEIVNFETVSFNGLDELRILDLRRNLIQNFDLNILRPLAANLEELYLQENRLQEFNYKELKNTVPKLTIFEFAGNPFNSTDEDEMEDFLLAQCFLISNSFDAGSRPILEHRIRPDHCSIEEQDSEKDSEDDGSENNESLQIG